MSFVAGSAMSGYRRDVLLASLLLCPCLLALAVLAPSIRDLVSASSADDVERASFLFWDLRLPRVLAAVLAGGAFALSGAVFQAATRNALAAPELIGVGVGGQAGVLLGSTVPTLQALSGPPLIFLCALTAAGATFFLAGGARASPLRLLLAGSATTLVIGAGISFALALLEQNVAGVVLWSGGALYQPGAAGLTQAALWLLPFAALLLPVLRPLSVMTIGDNSARGLGIDVGIVRFMSVVAATGFSAVAVAIAGPIGFVGLLAPNLLRLVGVHRLALQLPLAASAGSILLLGADKISIGAGVGSGYSVTVVTGLLGAPILAVLVLRTALSQPPESSEVATSGMRFAFGPVLLLLGGVLLAASMVGLVIGESFLTPLDMWSALSGHDDVAARILDIRGARIVVSAMAGAMLAAAGCVLQSVTRNPIAAPDIMGIVQGAALAVLAGTLAQPTLGRSAVMALSLAGATGTLVIVLAINRRTLAPLPLTLTGLALGGLCSSLIQALIIQSNAQPARALVWLIGGTYGRVWADVQLLLPFFALTLPALALLARVLDLLRLGSETSANLGLPLRWIMSSAMALVALLTGAAVAVVGPIGFVGLIAPHLARLMGFALHGRLLPVAMLVGAVLTVCADVAGRTLLAPTELPAGALTAIVGAPFLFWLLADRGRGQVR